MDTIAIMHIKKGEEIASMLVSGNIPGTGCYKFLAKKKVKGKYEWAHFVQRDSGLKEKMYTGEADDEKQLTIILEIMNRNLIKNFGKQAEMRTGESSFSDLQGNQMKQGEA